MLFISILFSSLYKLDLARGCGFIIGRSSFPIITDHFPKSHHQLEWEGLLRQKTVPVITDRYPKVGLHEGSRPKKTSKLSDPSYYLRATIWTVGVYTRVWIQCTEKNEVALMWTHFTPKSRRSSFKYSNYFLFFNTTSGLTNRSWSLGPIWSAKGRVVSHGFLGVQVIPYRTSYLDLGLDACLKIGSLN